MGKKKRLNRRQNHSHDSCGQRLEEAPAIGAANREKKKNRKNELVRGLEKTAMRAGQVVIDRVDKRYEDR